MAGTVERTTPTTQDPDVVPSAIERARRRRPAGDPLVGWCVSVGIAMLAFFFRTWQLGRPAQFSFDETYYAKDAWSLLNHGYVRGYVEGANDEILAGTTTGLWGDAPSMIAHPEVGKWMIAAGIKLFGMDPFGWRIASAVVGALMVLVLIRLVRRMTGSLMLGAFAGLLMTFDGLHLVLSRLALLDIFLAFWTLCAVTCLVADRQHTRDRMARIAAAGSPTDRLRRWGPLLRIRFRPWLLAAGVCFGLAVGTKWSALYPLAAFGVLVWLWDCGAQRSFGVRHAVLRTALVGGIGAFVHLVVVAGAVYTATWTGWLIHAEAYEQHLSETQYTTHDGGQRWPTADEPDASGLAEVGQSLRSLARYHRDVLIFHTVYLDDSEHTYQSHPAGWLLLNRPVGVDAQLDIAPGDQGCHAPADSTCLRQVLLLGTPVLWWGGSMALMGAAVLWATRRDWRFGVAVVGTASAWLPWFQHADRPIFSFYAIAVLPFLVLAVTLAAGMLIGPGRGPSRRRTAGTVVAGSFLVLVLVNFAWFWPIWTDELITKSEWLARIWFSRWI